ncbi:hypothetical protein BKA70DRAFT_1485827 [Coprinopsis sp. MPI-PUGE-AT-0042]|nr:hypothetical protein BKA70DRAFT_1485827 [Coprinopsis sp. MPI-PUGE-AT-0042]
MLIFSGKLDWYPYASNENIVMVVPAGFALNDPICAYWQWTADKHGNQKVNINQSGVIKAITSTPDRYQISFSFDYYAFDAIVASDFSTLVATMRSPRGTAKKPITLNRQYGDSARVPSTVVCTGKLNWYSYAANEMVTLVIPAGVSNGAPVGLYYQWTIDVKGATKQNMSVNATFRDVAISPKNEVKGTFDDGYYTFEATVLRGGQEATIRMSTHSGKNASFNLKQTDFRGLSTKKALIIRFGTGTDNGIFLVRDMLIKHLGFAAGDVELSYFDIDPPKGHKKCTKGQDPPTATRFKSKFTHLLSSASAGEVRFLYVDAHGTTQPDEDGVGGPDSKDEGWKLAGNDDGVKAEVVDAEWLGSTIRQNTKPGVNLTVLTSSCMGGGMLNAHATTPGILLAGCHETQFNIKALSINGRMVDPWAYAVTTVIKKRVQHNRGVPTYTVLFNEAKKIIKRQLASQQLSLEYLGPSPDETKPMQPHKNLLKKSLSSNQDPQMGFDSGCIDPDTERFLFPFTAGLPRLPVHGGEAAHRLTRYPRDEL